MPPEHFPHQLDALRCRYIRQPNHSAVLSPLQEHELAEIAVDRHDDATLSDPPLQNGGISGIGAAVTDFDDIVSLFTKPIGQMTTGAAINQEFHFATTRTASRESCAMIAWA